MGRIMRVAATLYVIHKAGYPCAPTDDFDAGWGGESGGGKSRSIFISIRYFSDITFHTFIYYFLDTFLRFSFLVLNCSQRVKISATTCCTFDS